MMKLYLEYWQAFIGDCHLQISSNCQQHKTQTQRFSCPKPSNIPLHLQFTSSMKSLQWKISAHTLTIKLSPSPARPSIVVISLNNHFEQFLSKQHLFCTSHFLFFVRGTFDTTSCITIIIVMNNTFYTLLYHHSSHRKMSLTVLLWEIKLLVPLQTVSPET